MPERYGVIYCDPPWSFKTYSRKGKGRSAEAHYDTMSLDDIKAMDVAQYAAKDCVLFMWVTDPFLPAGLEVIKAWQFRYKTVGFYWAKTSKGGMVARDATSDPQGIPTWPIGTGYWTRANPEPCLLATRGKPRRKSAAVRKLIVAPRRSHSQKPDETYQRIETLCTGPYLELFSRSHRDGWTCLGNEVDSGIGQRRWRSDMKDIAQ
jgi:N6-adenosine-specific RNA methylase IME4